MSASSDASILVAPLQQGQLLPVAAQSAEFDKNWKTALAVVMNRIGYGVIDGEDAVVRFRNLVPGSQAQVRYAHAQFMLERPERFAPGVIEAARGIVAKANSPAAYAANLAPVDQPGLIADFADAFVDEAASSVKIGGSVWTMVAVVAAVAVAAYVLPGAIARATAGKS